MPRHVTRRDFWKLSAVGGAFLAVRPGAALAHDEREHLPSGITREDLVNLVDGPWLRLRAVLEKRVIERALQLKGGNITQAALFLRIPRHILVYRIGKYGLRRDA